MGETPLCKWKCQASILVFHIEEYNIFQKNQMGKFRRNVKWKIQHFPFDKKCYRGEPLPYRGEKWPKKVEIDKKKSEKIYIALKFKKKLTCFCSSLKNYNKLKRVTTLKPLVTRDEKLNSFNMILQNYGGELAPYEGEKLANYVYIDQKYSEKIYFVLELKKK